MQELCDLVCRACVLTSMVLRWVSVADKTCVLVRCRALHVDVRCVKLQLLSPPSIAHSSWHSGRAGPVGCELSVQPAARNMLPWLLAMLFWRGLQGLLPQMPLARLQLSAWPLRAYTAARCRAGSFSAVRRRHTSHCLASLLPELPIHRVAADCGRPPFAEVPAMIAGSFWTSRWTSALLRHRSLHRKQMSSRQPPSKAKQDAGLRGATPQPALPGVSQHERSPEGL